MIEFIEPDEQFRSIKWSVARPGEIAAWVAEMDFVVADPVLRAVVDAVMRSDLGYAPISTDTALAEAWSHWYSVEHGWSFDPASVVMLPDVMRGVDLAIELWSAPGEGVLTTPPIYHPFLESIAEKGRRLVAAPLVESTTGFTLDLDAVRSGLASGVQLVLLSNPHNPTGRVFSSDELRALGALVVEHDAWLVSDEIHAPLVFPGAGPHVPIASLDPAIAARTLTLTSASKAWNIPGLKCAVAIASSDAMLRRLAALPEAAFFGGSPLGIHATIAALQEGRPWLAEVLDLLADNRASLADLLATHLPDVGYHAPESTYLAWLDARALPVPQGLTTAQWLLDTAGVRLSAGEDFGTGGTGRLRLNFATSGQRLTEMVERISAVVHQPPRTIVATR